MNMENSAHSGQVGGEGSNVIRFPEELTRPTTANYEVEEVPTISGDELLAAVDIKIASWGEKNRPQITLEQNGGLTLTPDALNEVAKNGLPQEALDHVLGNEVSGEDRMNISAVAAEIGAGGRRAVHESADAFAFADVPKEVLEQEQQAQEIVAATQGEGPGFFERHPGARKAVLSLFSVMGLAGLLGKSDEANAQSNYVQDVLKMQRSGGREAIAQGVISIIAGAAANRVAREIDPQAYPAGQPGTYQGQPVHPGQPGGVYAPGGYGAERYAQIERLQYQRQQLENQLMSDRNDYQRLLREPRHPSQEQSYQATLGALASRMNSTMQQIHSIDMQMAQIR